ncbi:hypothetical protein DB35_27800 [Streptomyces abyssalis]|uniref:Secreted protein n=2 Tax=Streptomyces abyssalis TaxID=933944 RepID=A0A1E7JLL4_9ACTN|nr:hypothetical protein [Streptomyces abyssalis]OEU87263.1 hypothetical protein DB35_27800 [Streptomyces abyssalis]OEU88536.1 hypothetical protein AN215_15880 [Streptomyces abyssalis]OEV29954.1 hypothetical protein AN219_13655 [Streptomyces nanshensis]
MGRRTLVHATAWMLATSGAVTLSWFGVHTVLAGTEYEPPRSLPIADGSSSTTGPGAPSPQQPEPAPSPSKSSPPEKPRPTASPSAPGGGEQTTKPPSRPTEPADPPESGKVEGASVAGGRAVFDMRDDYATLVSATPNDGWDMQVWKDSTWIRVTFSKDGASSSVFCRWDGAPPRIESYDNG